MAIGIKDTIEGAFARHETFTIRYGWLKRGFDHAIVDPSLFYADDVHHRLGVGKNMAKSIRFWLSASRLMDEIPDPDNGRRTLMAPTQFGLSLLAGAPALEEEDAYEAALAEVAPPFVGTVGLDPYLEDLSSWWLLHWMMLSPGGKLPVWWTAFHTFAPVSFTADSLLEHVMAQIETTSNWTDPKPPSTSSVKKDVLALLRAYAGTSGSRRRDKIDDEIDAPMVPLTLVRESDAGFRFAIGPKPELAPEVAAFACLDFLERTGATAKTALVSTLATEVGAPGRAFKVTERDLADLLAKAAAAHPDLLEVTSSSGSDTMAVVADASLPHVATMLLHRRYVGLGHDPDGVGFAEVAATPTVLPEAA